MPSVVLRTAALLALLLAAAPAAAQDAARGAYVAKAADCTGCHTAPGRPAMSGGLPVGSPFGPIYSTNITPDPDHGIGRYSLRDFGRAVRKGIARDGTHLYPAMPYTSYSAMSDGDLADLYAWFMRKVQPVPVSPPETNLMFPFNQRWGMALWNLVFLRRDAPEADRGAYLVRTLAHCGACHTPRNLAYAEKTWDEKSGDYLRGGTVDDWHAPDLGGSAAFGLGSWTEDDIAAFLRTGHARGGAAFGGMKTVVEDSTQHLSDEDLKAVARYLKSLPPRAGKSAYAPDPAATAALLAGQAARPGAGLYLSACAGCHQASGLGRPPKFPALAGNPAVLSREPASLIRLVLEGGASARTESGPPPAAMPAFGHKLTDREVAEVLTFIRNGWGNRAPPVTLRAVERMRARLEEKKSREKTPAKK